MRRYHSLLERVSGVWAIQFGDYDRNVVREERADLLDGSVLVASKDLKIITTADDQASINAAVAKLNEDK